MDDAARTQRRSLARVVEAALFFFGVTNEEQFEGLLDDAQQRTLLRDWLRSRHCPRDAAAVAADAMEVAQASAELQLLGRELEESEALLSAAKQPIIVRRTRPRASCVKLHVHVGRPQLACRSQSTQTETKAVAAVAAVATQIPTRSELAQRQCEEEQCQQQLKKQMVADMRPVLEAASAARRDASRRLVEAQELRNSTHAGFERAAAEASAAAADRADAAKDRVKGEALRAKLIDMEDTIEGLLEMYMEAKQLRPAMKLCAICRANVSEA